MSFTQQSAELFIQYIDEMTSVYQSETDWEIKFDLILGIAKELRNMKMGVEYYDPDTTYEEDTRTCYEAYAERARQYRLAYSL